MKHFERSALILLAVAAASYAPAQQAAPVAAPAPATAPAAAEVSPADKPDRSYSADYADRKANLFLVDKTNKNESSMTLKSAEGKNFVFSDATGGEMTVAKDSKVYTFRVKADNKVLSAARNAANDGNWDSAVNYMRPIVYPLAPLAVLSDEAFPDGNAMIEFFLSGLLNCGRLKEAAAYVAMIPVQDASVSIKSSALSVARALAENKDTESAEKIVDRISDGYIVINEDDILFFPSDELVSAEMVAATGDFLFERIQTIYTLLQGQKKIVILNMHAAIKYEMSPKVWKDNVFTLKVNDTINIDDLCHRLIKLGYESVYTIGKTGEFSKRGSIVDIFPFGYTNPIRLDFFGDDIEQIKSIAIIDQKALKLIKAFMPGPITLVLNKRPDVLSYINNAGTKKTNELAIRMATTPFLKELIKEVGNPIFLSSANISGKDVCKSLDEIEKECPTLDGMVLGYISFGEASTIVDLTGNNIKIQRPGPIKEEAIMEALRSCCH